VSKKEPLEKADCEMICDSCKRAAFGIMIQYSPYRGGGYSLVRHFPEANLRHSGLWHGFGLF
jgi:hypothetical protein